MAEKKYLDDVGTEYLVEKINDKIQLQFVGWQEYVRNQNILSDLEVVTIGPSESDATELEYDGFLEVRYQSLYNNVGAFVKVTVIDSKGNTFYFFGGAQTSGPAGMFTIPVEKGWKVYASDDRINAIYGTFYKLRDYTGR